MVRFIEQRGTGKTYRLLRLAEMNEGIFVCSHPDTMKIYAKTFDIDTNKITFISHSQFLNGNLNGSKTTIYIDELEILLKLINPHIEGYNFSLGDFIWWEKDNEDN